MGYAFKKKWIKIKTYQLELVPSPKRRREKNCKQAILKPCRINDLSQQFKDRMTGLK